MQQLALHQQRPHMGSRMHVSSMPAAAAAAAAVPRPLRHPHPRRHQQTPHALPPTADLYAHAADVHAHVSALLDLADAAAASASSSSSSSSGFLAPLTNTLEAVLKTFQAQLDRLSVPYSYGFSIILLTACVKLVTLPLTKIQVSVCWQWGRCIAPGWQVCAQAPESDACCRTRVCSSSQALA
jgi:hypothetical protein